MRIIRMARRALQAAEDVQTKAWYTSRTIWANLIALLGLALVYSGIMPEQWAPEVQAELVAAILTIVNVILRTLTSTPVGRTTVKSTGSRNPKL